LEEHAETVLRPSRQRVFGRYRLVYELASGGMATIHLAQATGPGGFAKLCVLKQIHRHLAEEPDFVQMFLDEANLSARIRHPNVCPVFDFGEVDGDYYIALEYLEGVPLTRLLHTVARDGSQIASRRWHALSARIIADAAEGLHAAHELRDDHGQPLSVVHRDVSPQNLFITYAGAVSVLDFGIAFATRRIHRTTGSKLKGKYAYLAPEQIASAPVDRRADVWALGVCLWECLSGARLFRRDSAVATLAAVRLDDIVPPSQTRPGVPRALDAVVMKALERDPARRYATARDLGRDLMAFVRESGEPADLPTLGAWMTDLFAGDTTTKLSTVTTTLPADDTAPLEPDPPTAAAEPDPRTAVTEPDGDIAAPASPTADPLPAVTVDGRRPPEPARTAASSMLLVVLATVAFASGTAALGGAWLGLASPPPTAVRPVQPPRAIDPPPVEPVHAVVSAPAPVAAAAGASVIGSTDVAGGNPDGPGSGADVRGVLPEAAAHDASAATRFGQVNVVVPGGWAEIREGGRAIGRTPTRLRLRPGRHVLELHMFGQGPPRRVTVNVQAGVLARVTESP
jgi:serine/threonine-protein kinase